ncbi:hypothetical protein TTHERM_00002750 (macronuclear) [Tetrahymena thermophila SB210]|uniref:Uncharacterized protein n=1 Tax=Tetrahymena thermophila (strain SB210) TaxID=312017 RepID=Q22SG1_TETTS|nr:hypothetical protein TTHERM_00002750 [Tetrahymena thermophila SB210]EAR87811.2 hypothetical protein TTHERM_00002750 [Tetrahymena thermophila SB210]|eukprot:XP_001008056.2 hypothetical protein TTHERM_00002750 [Tetrahymena thermophila SB210]
MQKCQTQINQRECQNGQIISQTQYQQLHLQDVHTEKIANTNINDVNPYEHYYLQNKSKKEEYKDYCEVQMNQLDHLAISEQRQLRCSFSTELTDRNGIDRNRFEIVSRIRSKTFQTNETQIQEELYYDDEEEIIQSRLNSQCCSQIDLCQNLNSSNFQQEQQRDIESPQQSSQQNVIQSYQKKQLINSNLFLENLKQEFLKFYDFKDEKKIAHQIYNDLNSKVNEKNSREFTQKSSLYFNQQLDNQLFTFKQCVYANLNSDISKQFANYCGQSNLNNITQNKQGILNAQLNNSNINRDDDNIQINNNNNTSQHQDQFVNSNQQCASYSLFQDFFCLKPKSVSFLTNFDFTDIRQNQPKKSAKKKSKKENSSYVKNSQFHNLNKLFMYNILGMFRVDALNNLNLSEIIIKELIKIIQRLKISSKRKHKKQSQGFYNYFTHSHYNILFLKINEKNIYQIKESPLDIDLHQQCFNINLSKNVSETEIAYMNLMKEINFQIFMANIRENQLIDDGTESKQNIRSKYTLRAINGIKKIAKGNFIKKF